MRRWNFGIAAGLAGPLACGCGGGDGSQKGAYRVGPGEAYAEIADVAGKLEPGDVVEVRGGSTYRSVSLARPGEPGAPITLRGVGGARPVVTGGEHAITFDGDHYVLEGFEVTGGSFSCILHRSHDVTVRDTVVHDCPGHGILGADARSGSLTLEYVEVRAAGEGDGKHPIYVATDETAHPGSVFRMQHSYVHDGRGGNNVKSRAERNEIHYNWIEGAAFLALELIGPDGQDRHLAREDSDVVGNVLVQTGDSGVIGVGGDGTGQSDGRYRFLNNTFVLSPSAGSLFRIKDGIQSLEVHNTVAFREGGGGVNVIHDEEASWDTGFEVIAGTGNWLPQGSTSVPAAWEGTVLGAEPGFADLAALDVTPTAESALVDAAADSPAGPAGFELPDPLLAPAFLPRASKQAPGSAAARPVAGALDIGAFEHPGS